MPMNAMTNYSYFCEETTMATFATYDDHSLILGGLQELGASIDFLAALADTVSHARLARALSGIKPLGSDHTQPLLRIVRELLEIKKESGYPLAFRNPVIWREIVKRRRAEQQRAGQGQ
jgi:hypothetical protein